MIALVEQPFICVHCSKSFMKEKTLVAHMCERKRRALQETEKRVQAGFMAYNRFYQLTQGNKVLKNYDHFCNSAYYNAFVKFGSFVNNVNPLYPTKFIDFVIKSGVKLSLKFDWVNAQIIKSFKLAGWSFVYALISQLSYLVTINIATSAAINASSDGITTGVGYTPYANAYLVLILPHSIIAVSIVTALLPKISNLVIDKKYLEITNAMSMAMKLIGLFTVPAAILFFAFGELVSNVLYFGISTQDANYLGLTLAAFAFGLIPVSINLVLLRGLNAFENLKSQVLGNLIMNLISVALSLLAANYLEPKYVTVGLAAIFTIHYFIGAGISFYLVKRHQIHLPVLKITTFYLKLILIFGLVITPIWLLRERFAGGNLIQLIGVVSVSVVLYFLILKLLKIAEVTSLIKVIKAGRQ